MRIKHLPWILTGISFVLLSSYTMMYPNGAPAGYTGSPGDAKNCTECHGGTATQAPGAITTNIPATGYVAGQTYQITATNNLTGSGKLGFEVSPQNQSGALLGTLAAGVGSKLVNNKYVTHTNANTTQKTWTFNWTAPAAGTGAVTFYGAFARNKPGPVSLSSLTVQELNTTALNEKAMDKLLITPNPNSGNFKVVLPSSLEGSNSTASIVNMAGINVEKVNFNNLNNNMLEVEMTQNHPGVYFLVIQNNSTRYTSKFVVR